MIFSVINAIVVVASLALPLGAIWFWISWYRSERHQAPAWRRTVGCIAAVCATGAIIWQHAFRVILNRCHFAVGMEDGACWVTLYSGVQIGLSLSLAGLLSGLLGKGRARIFAIATSALMGLTYLVLFSP